MRPGTQDSASPRTLTTTTSTTTATTTTTTAATTTSTTATTTEALPGVWGNRGIRPFI